jgi:hypothetical protein
MRKEHFGRRTHHQIIDERDLPTIASQAPPLIVEDDHGRFRLGLGDESSSGFESRVFATAVAERARRTKRSRCRQCPASRKTNVPQQAMRGCLVHLLGRRKIRHTEREDRQNGL